jgi:hypothetical protein
MADARHIFYVLSSQPLALLCMEDEMPAHISAEQPIMPEKDPPIHIQADKDPGRHDGEDYSAIFRKPEPVGDLSDPSQRAACLKALKDLAALLADGIRR